VFVSHDGVLGVVTRTERTYKQLYQRVLDWNPREDRTWYFKGIGAPASDS